MKHFGNVQAVRAIASTMVLLSHVLDHFLPIQSHWIALYLFNFGPGGVDLFFVVSGFIIYTVAKRSSDMMAERGRFAPTLEFLVKRLIRIYPIYWLAFGMVSFAALFASVIPPNLVGPSAISQFLLLTPINTRIIAAWSLHYEMYFYLVATLVLFFAPTNLLRGFIVWFAAIGLIDAISQFQGYGWTDSPLVSPILFEFALGIAVALLVERGKTGFGVLAVGLGVICFGAGSYIQFDAGGWYAISPWHRVALWAFPGSLILYGLIALEISEVWTFPKSFQWLGDASYSIYLTHQLTFALLAALATATGIMDIATPIHRSIAAIAIAIAVGCATYYFLERAILKSIGELVLGRRVRVAHIEN